MDESVDYYALFDLPSDATLKQIRTAYRQKSLKVHPDRNPDNPQAAHLFHELSLAHEILIDPVKRDSFDKIYKARQARAERFKTLDSKRKGFADDLLAREEAYKKARTEERSKERDERAELERLKSEGENLRKAKEKKHEDSLRELQDEEDRRLQEERDRKGQLGPLDTTVRLKWQRKHFPALELDEDALRALLPLQASINIDSIVISGKMATNPKLKSGTALISLKTLSSAVKCVESSGQGKLEGIEVSWASGQEPEMVRKQRERETADKKRQMQEQQRMEEEEEREDEPPLKVPRLDEESVLDKLRARERERERMEEEIKRQDEAEEAAAANGH